MDLGFLRHLPYARGREKPSVAGPELGLLLVGIAIRQTCSPTTRAQIGLNLGFEDGSDQRLALFGGERGNLPPKFSAFAELPLAATPRTLARLSTNAGEGL